MRDGFNPDQLRELVSLSSHRPKKTYGEAPTVNDSSDRHAMLIQMLDFQAEQGLQ